MLLPLLCWLPAEGGSVVAGRSRGVAVLKVKRKYYKNLNYAQELS